jgi:hypothetical protein
MNRINKSTGWVAIIAMLSVVAGACVKTPIPNGTASLIVVNAVAGSAPLVTNFSDADKLYWNKNAYKVSYGVFTTTDLFTAYSGEQRLRLFQYPDTTDHSIPLFNLTLGMPISSIHTLFLVGTVASPDTMFVQEHLPYYQLSDSVTGIRFANLSPGSTPISINMKGKPNGSEFSSLPYKGLTDFKAYPATSKIINDTFEFRNAQSGVLLSTYVAAAINRVGLSYFPNTWLYRNSMVAFVGLPGGTGTTVPKAYLINYN